MRRSIALGMVVAAALLAAGTPTASGQPYEWRPGEGVPGANGVINSFLNWDADGDGPGPERLVVGGSFTAIGSTAVDHIATWDGTTWQSLGSGVNGPIYAMTVYNGRLVVGGTFTSAGGVACENIAAWDGTAWQPLDGGLYNGYETVRALIVYNGELIAGGDFIQGGTTSCRYLARWNGAAWQPLGGGTNGSVGALAIYDDKLIVAGSFSSAGGVAYASIAAWDGTSWQALAGGLTGGGVNKLVLYNDELVAGGSFTAAGGISSKGLARWNGTAWQGFSGITNGNYVADLVVHEGQLVAGGDFFALGGVACKYIARWTGSSWQQVGEWTVGTSYYVDALAVYQGQLIVGGNFTNIGSLACNYLGKWDGTSWQRVAEGTNGIVYCLAVHDEKLVAGGAFTVTSGGPCSRIACRDEAGWHPLGSGMNNIVYSLATYNEQLIAGGAFTNAGGAARSYIARWDGEAWQALGTGTNGIVYAMVVYKGQLIAGGAFTSAGGTACSRIARWDGTAWQPLDGGVNGTVSCLAVYGELLVAGGQFATAGGITCNRIACWDGTAWQPMGTGMNGIVNAVTVHDGQLVAGGEFSSAGGVTCYSVARWNGSSWQPMDSGTNGSVSALTVCNGELFAAGPFGAASGVAARTVARWDGTRWQPMAGGLNGSASYALAAYNGELVVGGNWNLTYDGKVSSYWARWGPVMPTILQQPASQSILRGEPASFSVKAIGAATLHYQWRKDGVALADDERIHGATSDTLTIDAVAVADGGNYECVIVNSAGAAVSDAAVLTVLVPATIDTQPASVAVQARLTATFSVVASGTPVLSYQWRKNGVALTDGERIAGSTTRELTISAIEMADADTYDVVVTNAYGTETSAAVSLTILPTIVTQPVGVTIRAGEPISLSAAAVGSGTLTYQWRKDEVPLSDGGSVSGATTPSLTIDPSQPSDANNYDVVITSEFGTVTSATVQVVVMLPPSIVIPPVSQSVPVGQPVTLSVTASGSGTLTYQWRKDGAALADDERISGSTTASLTIQPTQAGDAGSYDVVVTSEWGTATSEAATVSILLPPSITVQPASQSIVLGQPVTLSVTASGSGTLTYQWRKDGAPLSDGGRIGGAATANLAIDPSQAGDAGSYDVVVTSEYGTATSETATVGILLPPSITVQPAGQSALVGEPVTLTVTANGSGTLSYQWRKDGAALTDDGRISGSTTAALVISSAQTSDTGSYDVVVASEYGTATSNVAAVTVAVPITIFRQPNHPYVRLGEPATMSVDVTAGAPISYQWRKAGVPLADGGRIHGATTYALTIDAAGVGDAGTYDVVISAGGESVTSEPAIVTILSAEATPAGSPVSVPLVDPNTGQSLLTVTFQNVTTAGLTAVNSMAPSAQHGAPAGFKFGQPPMIYELETNAVFSGTIELCLNYNSLHYGRESRLRLFHFDNGAWVDVTTRLDMENDRIYGEVTHFSAFAILEEEEAANTAPAVTITGPQSGTVKAIDTNVTLTATISDPDVGDTHTATWTLRDGYWGERLIPAVVNGNTIQTVTQMSEAGVYDITLTVTDAAGATATTSVVCDDPQMRAFVVAYDRSAGFVTGGGWINSPAGALKWNPDDTNSSQGIAVFGFVSRYKRGISVPTGATAFHYQAGHFTFASAEYDWLVVAGQRARYFGHGVILGMPGMYAFTLTAVDSSAGDRFRIKIWDESTGHVIYDNRRGLDDDADPTRISGGSIQIHR